MMTKQEELFFDRVAVTMNVDPTLTVEAAARKVLDDDIRILNTYARLSDAKQAEMRRMFVARVYHALTQSTPR